ncbi:hypothetical protein CHUAL_004063 [Chamberlinius hualienensis]
MKASFSMSSLRDDISQEQDEGPTGTPATLPRRKALDVCTRYSRDNIQKRDEFWEALQPNYDYLMDDGLIASCKEANGELSWGENRDLWSYEKFIACCEELWSLGEELDKSGGVQPEEFQQFDSKIRILNEQSQNLVRTKPTCAEEVLKRTTEINQFWDTLQHCVAPEESHDERTSLKREIACQIRWLRKWIRGMEVQLGPIYRKSEWTSKDIETKLNHHRVVQKEIESREKNVLGVFKLCQRFEDLKESERRESLDGGGSSRAAQQPSRDSCNWIKRDFEHLQKRFHALWLHSLEWQCWLEGLLASGPQAWGSLREDASSSSSDEPNRKIPRLSLLAEGKGATAVTAEAGATTSGSVSLENVDMVGMAGPVRPTDHHDVGYSSESSAHLSNEDGAVVDVRVYTYTSVEAKSPRVLEVVMNGDYRPRKTPRDSPNKQIDDGEIEMKDQHQTSVMQAGSNCGTFYYRHVDSDAERPCHRQRINGRKRLNFGSRSQSEDDADDDEEADISFSEVEETEAFEQWSDGIHKLVDEAEELVKSSTREPVVTVDSSCDASGEYTSSSSSNSCNDSDVESSSDPRGSVIHIKNNGSLASVVSDGGQKQPAVKLRTKKRRNGERPSSVVEASQLNFNLKFAAFSNSETALNRMKTFPKKGGAIQRQESRPKRSPRRCSNRKGSFEIDGKCRSLGSLRHSSSSDNGRWKSAGSNIFPKSYDDQCDSESGSKDSSDEFGSSKENDGELTLVHVPDNASSASEQAWDDYQEAPYLSEAYSEQGIDDEAVRRLMEFGDDYQVYMGLPSSDGASTPSFYASRGKLRLNNCGFDSESDLEDMNDLLEQHTKMLDVTQLQLQKMALGECPKIHLEDVLASVQIHITCLRAVLEQLRIPLHLSGPGHQNRDRLRLEWERLVMQATEQEERLAQLGQLQNEAKELEKCLKETMAGVNLWSNKVVKEEDLFDTAKVEIQKQRTVLEQLNPTLVNLNCKTHNYVTRWNLDVVGLKNQVHTLYRTWDQVKETIEKKLIWLDEVEDAWKEYKAERKSMQDVLSEVRSVLNKFVQTIKCSPNLLTAARTSKKVSANKNQVSMMREKLLKSLQSSSSSNSRSSLANMTKAANRLKEVLGAEGDVLSLRVAEEVEEATKETEAHEWESKQLLKQLTAILDEQEVLEQISLNRNVEEIVHHPPVQEKVAPVESFSPIKRNVKSKEETMIWRVIRAALPIQLAVVILFCFACLFEPHCCDTLNNFNLSLSPQLRYLDGPPPV